MDNSHSMRKNKMGRGLGETYTRSIEELINEQQRAIISAGMMSGWLHAKWKLLSITKRKKISLSFNTLYV